MGTENAKYGAFRAEARRIVAFAEYRDTLSLAILAVDLAERALMAEARVDVLAKELESALSAPPVKEGAM